LIRSVDYVVGGVSFNYGNSGFMLRVSSLFTQYACHFLKAISVSPAKCTSEQAI